jgi:hypothetical protein
MLLKKGDGPSPASPEAIRPGEWLPQVWNGIAQTVGGLPQGSRCSHAAAPANRGTGCHARRGGFPMISRCRAAIPHACRFGRRHLEWALSVQFRQIAAGRRRLNQDCTFRRRSFALAGSGGPPPDHNFPKFLSAGCAANASTDCAMAWRYSAAIADSPVESVFPVFIHSATRP